MKFLEKQWFKKAATSTLAGVLMTANVFAADAPKPSELNNSLAIVLLIVIVGLLVAIGLLANVVSGVAELYVKRLKEKKASEAAKILTVIALCLFTSAAFAADGPAADAAKEVVTTTFAGLSKSSFYGLLCVIALELIVVFTLLFQLRAFLTTEKALAVATEEAVEKESAFIRIWAKLNSFKPEHEVVDTGHNYDGIRELDNSLPKWWLYGFYACIIFAFVYLYRFHVSHTGLSSEQEYQTEMAKADLEKEEYLKSAANKVDENTVTLLTDAAALGEGKKLFSTNCSPCHGAEAQGIVGPNLTDDYWLHKGGIKDVFKTIKYGVQEKGMKSWKDDFSPVQIAELASFIKSLHGTKPGNAKDPQGELYKEEGQAKSSPDTTKTADKKLVVN
jgi:cytochrome c oxidase cbb3-type subunit 3